MSACVSGLHHVTIGCTAQKLATLAWFYTGCIGLQDGLRPALRFPGHWLYINDQAVLHLNALLDDAHPPYGLSTVDHVSFRAHGLAATREWLRSEKIEFSEIPLSGTRLHQVFLRDPVGTRVELTFDLDEEQS